MNIKLCTFATVTIKGDAKLVLKTFQLKERNISNKIIRNFIKFIRLLETNPFWEKQVYQIRKDCNIPKNGLEASNFTAILNGDYNRVKTLLGKEKEKKLNHSVKKLLKKFKLSKNKQKNIYWFVTFDLFLVLPPDKLFIHWSEPSDQFFPDYTTGGVSILIQSRLNKSELIKLINKRWPLIEEKMKNIKQEEYPLPKFHDLDLMITIYKLRKSGKKYTEIKSELQKNNTFLEEDTLRQKFKALNDYFKREE